ncbi:MAG: carboxypeptidase-like regulatory domain-containing protein, partial [Thermoplasmatota archaeon]
SWTFSITDEVVVTGTVYGPDGYPVSGARIVLDSGRTALTNGDGEFNITARMGQRTLLVIKEGFRTENIVLDLSPDRKGYGGNIFLEKEKDESGIVIPSFVSDPWTYVVISLILVILGLVGFLQRERFVKLMDRMRGVEEVTTK